jgi:hypothetical protein
MIRFPNPLWTRLTAAQAVAHTHLQGEALRDMLEALSLQHVEPEIQFFFPYEVQVMDIASFEAATLGRASYADYKVRQIQSVRRRILPRVLELTGHGELLRDDPPPMSSHRGGAHQPIPLKKRMFAKTGMLPSAVRSGTDDP